ncbi:hypothetical protein JQX13_31445 [Archangium violaceum]|uniref:hypothetical protein n=1 Tax=Archangium violaceum TaxID=83451 RepID=UPI00193B7322|nr:hypothetical protein [Archangium violaceum]QRK04733.1 hypothetical protein JQX13_31445 [Archangium violaceum]
MARSPASEQGRPGTRKTWCDGTWVDSLPAGFNKDNIAAFYEVPGGCATPISDGNPVSFAVAASTSGGFLGLSEHLVDVPTQKWEVRLYSSPDLVHWTFMTTIRQTDGSWDTGDLHFPAFLSANDWRSDLVSENAFYVVGTINTSEPRMRALPGANRRDGRVHHEQYGEHHTELPDAAAAPLRW